MFQHVCRCVTLQTYRCASLTHLYDCANLTIEGVVFPADRQAVHVDSADSPSQTMSLARCRHFIPDKGIVVQATGHNAHFVLCGERSYAIIPAIQLDGKSEVNRRSLLKVVAELLKILMKLADRTILYNFTCGKLLPVLRYGDRLHKTNLIIADSQHQQIMAMATQRLRMNLNLYCVIEK